MTSSKINAVIQGISLHMLVLSTLKKLSRLETTTIKRNNLENLELSEQLLVFRYLSFFPDLIAQHLCDEVFMKYPLIFKVFPDKMMEMLDIVVEIDCSFFLFHITTV